ncbi:MAG: histidine kinase [Anaerolineales bacterium]|nr:histidine kinase [Anaerolineales bacterium]
MEPKSKAGAGRAGVPWRGFTPQIVILIILPITALVLLVALGGLDLHQDAMRTLVGERDQRAAQAAASTLTEQVNHRSSAIKGLALRAAPQYSNSSPQEIIASADYLLPDFDHGLGLFDRTGKMLAGAGDIVQWAESGAFDIPDLKNTVSRDVPPVFTLVKDPLNEEPVIITAASVSKGGPIALGAFSPAVLSRNALISAFSADDQAAAMVVSPDGQVLFQNGSIDPDEPLNTHPGVAAALRGESGTTYYSVDGREHVVAFSPVSPVGWALVIEEPWDAVASPLLRTTEGAPLVMVPLLLVAVLALWLAVRQVVQPLRELEARAASLAWGDYQAIKEPVGGIVEIGRLQRTLIYLAGRVQSSQRGLRSYIGAITMGQEDERRRLARELHDDTIQALIALNQRVQLTRLNLNGEEAGETLDEISAMTEQTIRDLRRITQALRPLYLEDLGLVAALDMLAREVSQVSGIPVRFQRQGTEVRLPPTEELALYRIAQEGLNNIMRHAEASQVELTIQFAPGNAVLTIHDNGQGFLLPESPAELAHEGQFGILGLYERAELIGATLEIETKPERGSKLTVALPLEYEVT